MARRTVQLLGVLATALATCLLVWASVSGPDLVGHGAGAPVEGDHGTRPPVTMPAVTRPPARTTTSPVSPGRTAHYPPWLSWLLTALVLALVVAIGYRIARWYAVQHRLDDQREEREIPPDLLAPVVDDQVVAEHHAALESGTPRNGIVACWVELERLVAGAGTRRAASETPTELVHRVLRAHDVPADAITDLAELYREARFSSHELGEDRRDEARTALDRIHVALAAGARP